MTDYKYIFEKLFLRKLGKKLYTHKQQISDFLSVIYKKLRTLKCTHNKIFKRITYNISLYVYNVQSITVQHIITSIIMKT